MTDDIDDRLSRRFASDGNDEKEQNEKNGGNGEKEENDTGEENDTPAQNDESDVNEEDGGEPADRDDDSEEEEDDGWGVNNVKDEWTARSIYLPDTIESDLSRTFKQADLNLDVDGIDRDFRKTRHFYPVLVALGIERMAQMESVELMEFLDEIQQREKGAGEDDE